MPKFQTSPTDPQQALQVYFNPFSPIRKAAQAHQTLQTVFPLKRLQNAVRRYGQDRRVDIAYVEPAASRLETMQIIHDYRQNNIYESTFRGEKLPIIPRRTSDQRHTQKKSECLSKEFMGALTSDDMLSENSKDCLVIRLAKDYVDMNLSDTGRDVFIDVSRDDKLGGNLMNREVPIAATTGAWLWLEKDPYMRMQEYFETRELTHQPLLHTLDKKMLRECFEIVREDVIRYGRPNF